MSAAKPTVWVSRIMMDSTLIKAFTSDAIERDKDATLQRMEMHQEGLNIAAKAFPQEFYSDSRHKKIKKQPDIFLCGGFWCVSSAVAEVLQRFDLGEGSVYPTKLFQFDRETPVEGEYFCLNFGARQQFLVPEQSPGAKIPRFAKPNSWILRPDPQDGDLAVRAAALKGADLWTDPCIRRVVFLSDPLVQALKAAKLSRRFGLQKCAVLSDH